jgi:starch synthase
MIKVLYAAAEVVPFVKTGGLADVAGSLPKALKAQGLDIRVVLPKYGKIPEKYREQMVHIYDGVLPVAWRSKYLGVDSLQLDGVTYYFIDNEEYFQRDQCYGYEDDAERFSFFCRAVLNLLPEIDFWPDVLHANDWHTGLIPVLLRLEHSGDSRYEAIRTLFTIHNLKYQGIFPKDIMTDVLGLDWQYFQNGDMEFYDAVNFMKGAIVYSDCITTVSRTYAQEIQYEYFGEGIDGLLRARRDHLVGIVNGLDYDVYNPRTDENLFETYDVDTLDRKVDNKVALQRSLGLPESRRVPMLALVSRLVPPKGLDLGMRIFDELLQHEDMQLVVLGTGDKVYEDWFRGLAWRFPTKVSVNICFSNTLAQRIYAASSHFLMPSCYEPCGIGQLIALRYGSIPVVRATGGLKDTVQPYDKYTGQGNGFLFPNYNAHEFMFAIKKALSLYKNLQLWRQVVENAMRSDYSWTKSAQEYRTLYEDLLVK